jgi:hypothetical protein
MKKSATQTDPRAGKPADPSMLVGIPRLMTAYYTRRPDASVPEQRAAFGTSGHRGSAFDCAFNEDHILAITQAICDYRRWQEIDGPLFLGIGLRYRPGGAGGPRDGSEDRRSRGLHADPGHLPRHPHLQRQRTPPEGPGRRNRGHTLPQPPGGRRLQVQPARRGSRGRRGDRLDPGAGQRAAGRRPGRRQADPLRAGAPRRHHSGPRLPGLLRERPRRGGGGPSASATSWR